MKIKKLIFLLVFSFVTHAVEKQGKKFEFEWLNDDEQIFVIQDKEFPKSQRFNFEFFYIDSENQPYFNTSGIGGSLSYFFNEDWGIDFTYKSYSSDQSNDLKSLINDRSTKPLLRRVDDLMLLSINWLPFYGKVNLFNSIFYFDWGWGLGFGKLTLQSNEDTFTKSNVPLTLKESKQNAYSLKTFFKFYAFENVNFGIQYDLTFFNAVIDSQGTEDLVNINDIILTIGYMFP